jgi:type I restriction enzyme R subunit
VEKTLTPLFDKNPVLQKIRSGEPITEDELNDLNALIHTQNEHVDLTILKDFFPESTAGIDQLLRTIVGLDTGAIEAKFMHFVQSYHIQLNSLQQRFLALLKSEICRRGEIAIADLYDQPFKSLHQDGIDGLFQEEQAQLIANFIAGFTVKAGVPKDVVNMVLNHD